MWKYFCIHRSDKIDWLWSGGAVPPPAPPKLRLWRHVPGSTSFVDPGSTLLSKYIDLTQSLPLNLTIPTIVFLKSVWNYSLLRLRPHKARAFPIQSFFSSSQEMSTSTWNHKTNTKQFIIHARPACGSVILPQIYTKKGEELLDYLCALTLRVVNKRTTEQYIY